MHDQNCIFCKIINGDLPSAKVYEDEHVYAFLDLSQITKGHTLIIPKIHTANIFETPSEVAESLFARVPKIASALKATYQPKGMNIVNNNGEFADQTVFHLHVHLIPRYDENDGYKAQWISHQDDYSGEDLQKLAEEIKANI